MVVLSNLYAELKGTIVTGGDEVVKLFSIVGMAGIGKTTLAKKIYTDFDFVEWFDCRAWVAVGREWQLQKITRAILVQVNPDYADEMLCMEEHVDDDTINECLKESLKGKRYLIVLDDVWDVQVWFDLQKILTTSIQNEVHRKVLLTSRIQEVVDRAGLESGIDSLDMRLLDKEESWDLFHEKVFAAESCSFKLEKAGRRIAEKCDGLPLTIVTVADLLSKEEKTVEYSTFENVPFVHESFPSKL